MRWPVVLAHVLREDAPRLDATRDVDAHVAVQRRADVVRPQRGCDPDRRRFVAAPGVEGARNLALFVEDVAALLDAACDQHVPVDAEQVLAVEPRLLDLTQRAERLCFTDRHRRGIVTIAPQYSDGVGKAADWLREERRKTLGDWVASAWENPWFPHEPPPSPSAAASRGLGSRRAKPGSACKPLFLFR